MENISHPSTFIKQEWQALIRNTAAEAEELEMLHPQQLALIYQQKWFKALVPVTYGGLGLSLPGLIRLQESLSWADGSFGWVFTLCCGAGWFAGFIDKNVAPQIFNGEYTCLAGSGAKNGEAINTGNGYRITGEWNYASGAHHATHFTANCIIKNADGTVVNEKGKPLVLAFIFDKKNVELLATWKYIGMVATGSNSFKVENLLVNKNRSFKIDPAHATLPGKLYQYPFHQLAEATLAANLMGMAIHFVDHAEEIIKERCATKYTTAQKEELTRKLKCIKTNINTLRADFYNAVDVSWGNTTEDRLNEVSITSRQMAKGARNIVDDLYPYCGLQAASPDTEINRVWRDLHTASQHSLLVFES
jgi:alkylation response protein AidB-like acyl-CoA dehydrogenase